MREGSSGSGRGKVTVMILGTVGSVLGTTIEQEAYKFIVLMLKLVKWEEWVVLVCPTFEGDPIGFEPSASPSAPKPATHSRKLRILVITESMFKMLVLDYISI